MRSPTPWSAPCRTGCEQSLRGAPPVHGASILPLGWALSGCSRRRNPSRAQPASSAPGCCSGPCGCAALSPRFPYRTLPCPRKSPATITAQSQILGARLAFMFLFSVLMPAAGAAADLPAQRDGARTAFRARQLPAVRRFLLRRVLVMATSAAVGTRRYAIPLRSRETARSAGKLLTRDLLRTLSNRSFRYLIGFDISMMMSYGMISALNMLVWTYYWEFDARRSRSFSPCRACSPWPWCCSLSAPGAALREVPPAAAVRHRG
jgi:hypothetical protein